MVSSYLSTKYESIHGSLGQILCCSSSLAMLQQIHIKICLPYLSSCFPAVGCRGYQRRTVCSFHIRRRFKFLDHHFTNNFKRRYEFLIHNVLKKTFSIAKSGGNPLRKNHMKKPTCESRVKLEQHFTCDPHVVKTHVIDMWNTCDFTMGDF